MYESGMLNGDSNVLIAGGKVVSHEEALECGLPVWGEVSAMLSLNLNRPLPVQGGSYHQFQQKASYPFSPQLGRHTVRSGFSSPYSLFLFFSFRS